MCRSRRISVFTHGFSNLTLFIGVFCEMAILVIVVFVPGVQTVFVSADVTGFVRKLLPYFFFNQLLFVCLVLGICTTDWFHFACVHRDHQVSCTQVSWRLCGPTYCLVKKKLGLILLFLLPRSFFFHPFFLFFFSSSALQDVSFSQFFRWHCNTHWRWQDQYPKKSQAQLRRALASEPGWMALLRPRHLFLSDSRKNSRQIQCFVWHQTASIPLLPSPTIQLWDGC